MSNRANDGWAYHRFITYVSSFPEIFTEFSSGQELAMQAEASRADPNEAGRGAVKAETGGRPSTSRPVSARCRKRCPRLIPPPCAVKR
eukprot:scaffold69825_cov31-Prasinocladus_malaysianus.AAC.1